MAAENTKTRKAYRQGELLFVPLTVEDMAHLAPEPDNQSYPYWKKLQTNVLREGEATGHKHEVMAAEPGMATMQAPARQLMPGLPDMETVGSEDRLLVVEKSVEIVHPEHRPLTLPRGHYLVVVQREYDEVKARRIMD